MLMQQLDDHPIKKKTSKEVVLELTGQPTCCTYTPKNVRRSVSAETLSTDEARGPVGACRRPGLKVATRCRYDIRTTSSSSRTAERPWGISSSTPTDYVGMVRAVKGRRRCAKKPVRTSSPLVRPPPPVTPPWPEPADHLETSQRMKDSFQRVSHRPTHFNLSEFRRPGDESFVAGRPKSRMGNCLRKDKRPGSDEEEDDIIRMRKRNFKFWLTQDPRKSYCLVNPLLLSNKPLDQKQEYNYLTSLVRNAGNLCGDDKDDSSVTSSEHICEVIDVDNPLQLDFQGVDYKATYEKDEQDLRNQRVYNRVCRYMERARVKREIEKQVDEEAHKDNIKIPDIYLVENREERPPVPIPKPRVPFGQLFRSPDKPYNKETIEAERERRRNRYRQLYETRQVRKEQAREAAVEKQKTDKVLRGVNLSNKQMDDKFEHIENRILLSTQTHQQPMPPRRKLRQFPHTTKDTLRYRKDLKQKMRMDRYRALEKGELLRQRTGKIHVYPQAQLEISSDEADKESASAATSYESSDDQDGMDVGKAGEKFVLRGFHNKMTDDVRGKFTERQKKADTSNVEPLNKTVLSRDDWVESLVPAKEEVKTDVVRGIETITDPDHPKLNLFQRDLRQMPVYKGISPIKKFIQTPIGHLYDRRRLKELKIVKPKLFYTIKKFNLIRYLFGDSDAPTARPRRVLGQTYFETLPTAKEYMLTKMAEQKAERQRKRKQRLETLGIPCDDESDEELKTMCNRKIIAEDLDFVPNPDPDILSDQEAENELEHQYKKVKVPMRLRGNMPAPPNREATLRRHPRRPRPYFTERIPSKLFINAMDVTRLPVMRKLPNDSIAHENVRQISKAYGKRFGMRHHHDHWIPTQKRQVNVQYHPKLADAKPTSALENVQRVKKKKPFVKANPACKEFVDMDLTLPYTNYKSLIKEHQLSKERSSKREAGGNDINMVTKNKCRATDTIVHTLKPEERDMEDYPGHREYLKLLQEMRANVARLEKSKYAPGKTQGGLVHTDEYTDNLVRELNEDLDSIESCISSLSSSQCTNLTNDSGSFLLVEKKRKVPLDYVRKSVIPFEETHRTRFSFQQIDKLEEERNPFRPLPFVGQRQTQINLTAAKDGFFTFNTRLRNGARLNLEVRMPAFHERLLGKRKKYHPKMTIDVDEHYVSEMRKRPTIKLFANLSCREVLKEALRIKFETMLVQGEIVRNKVQERLNDFNYQRMLQLKSLYEKLFAKWEKREYEQSMRTVYTVKSYYDATDVLRREWHQVDFRLQRLNMDIVYLEADFIRRIMLQNFHYLMADMDWRRQHDWIHRLDPDGEEEEDGEEVRMEDFVTAIKNRPYVNCRLRDKDDAFAIKDWFENVHVLNTHPLLVVYPDINKFVNGMNTLRSKTYVMLLELHFTLQLHSELSGQLQFFTVWCKRTLIERHNDVVRKCARKNFMQDRSKKLQLMTNFFLKRPLWDAFNDDEFNTDLAVLTEVWRCVVPANIRGASERVLDPCDMVTMMADVLMDMLDKFEQWSPRQARRREAFVRRQRIYDMKMSYKAYLAERRIEQEMRNVHRNIEPPFVKPPRPKKLPCMIWQAKHVPPPPQEHVISEATRFFYRAFHEDEPDERQYEDHDDAHASLLVMDTIQEQIIVPFYFDYFLKLNGYTPNYNYPTTADVRDGPELARLGVRSVVPEIMWKMERWETMRKKIMEENIARNPKMYENLSS